MYIYNSYAILGGKEMKFVWKFLNSKVPLWYLLIVLLCMAGGYIKGYIQKTKQVERSYSMITSLKKVEEVVFLNAGIQSVVTKSEDKDLFGNFKLPGSKKKAIIILNYKAKFGIKNPVKINKKGENTYQIIVPKFDFIGHELNDKDGNNGYEIYDKSGQLLSFATEDIDTGAIVTKSLSSKKQKKYLIEYNSMIKESAIDYYNNLFKMIGPEAQLKFTFQ